MATLCFTGHRNIAHYDATWINQQLVEQIKIAISDGCDSFISGGAIGIDQIAATLVIGMKQTNKVKLVIARPFPSQSSIWPQRAIETYRDLLSKTDFIYDVNNDPKDRYEAIRFLQTRNEWMVNQSNRIIAVWDGNNGGTANCFRYAMKQRKDIVHIDPKTKRVNILFQSQQLDLFE